jgi:hypothetical protein
MKIEEGRGPQRGDLDVFVMVLKVVMSAICALRQLEIDFAEARGSPAANESKSNEHSSDLAYSAHCSDILLIISRTTHSPRFLLSSPDCAMT